MVHLSRFRAGQLALYGLFALVTASAVQAAPLTYSTSGVFGVSNSNTANFTVGGNTLTLTFTGIASSVADPDPSTFLSFGTIKTTTTSTTDVSASSTFTLTITQSAPVAGSGTLTGSLSGSVKANESTNLLTVTINSATIGGNVYQFTQTSYALVPPSTNSGNTTLQGRVTQGNIVTAVPEPTSVLLLGSGLMLIIAGRFRRSA